MQQIINALQAAIDTTKLAIDTAVPARSELAEYAHAVADVQEAQRRLESAYAHMVYVRNKLRQSQVYAGRAYDQNRRTPIAVFVNGEPSDYDKAFAQMDDEIREDVHLEMAVVYTAQQFIDAYCGRHKIKFGKAFQVK